MRVSLHPSSPLHRARRAPLLSLLSVLALVLLTAAVPAAAQPGGGPRLAAGPGVEATAPDGSPAERVALGPALLTRLLAVAPEGEARVADWPIAPGLRADVVLARRDVYAPDARIFRVEGTRRTELPRSDLVFFWGTAEGDDTTRVFVTLDPRGRLLHSFAQSRAGLNELRPVADSEDVDPGASAPGQYLVASAEALAGTREAGAPAPSWTCGDETLGTLDRLLNSAPAPAQLGALAAPALSSLHTATLAIDTDNELMSQKFADSTTAATNYIASLVAAMNVMYERDLKVRLLQGTTFLRVSSTPDPYPSGPSSAADGTKLNEFSGYWSVNYGNVTRALAVMLSGKQSTSNSASGIASINSLCSKANGYSFSQVFKINYLAGDALVVGHEIGHNFGSPHTHCYSPPIDNCYNAQGCYSGTPSCPAPTTINGVTNVTGTVMSYCHVSGLAGCSSSLVFHSRTVQLFDGILPGKVGVCVFPLAGQAPVVSAVSPASGATAGGTAVTVTGANFLAGATVSIGGVPATSVAVADSTRLTAVTGAHAAGTVSVAVTNPGGGAGSLANSFFYAAPAPGGEFYTLAPCRAVDTRLVNSPLGGPALAPSAQRLFKLTGACGIPAGALAVSANVTVVGPPVAGFFSFFPGNAFPMGTSTLSFSAGLTRANNALLTLATDGTGRVGVQNASGGTVQLLIDVNGYYQ